MLAFCRQLCACSVLLVESFELLAQRKLAYEFDLKLHKAEANAAVADTKSSASPKRLIL